MAFKRKSKAISILLTLALLLALWPGAAVADPDTISVTSENELRDAVTGAVYDTISIDDNIDLNSSLTINQNVTLTSANGSKLDLGSEVGRKINIPTGKNVTFNGNLQVTGDCTSVVAVESGASFTLDGSASVTQESTVNYRQAVSNTGGAVFITGGSVVGGYFGINNPNGTVTVTDGSVTGTEVSIYNSSELTVTGGVITGVNYGIRVMGTTGLADIRGDADISGKIAMQVGTSAAADISGGSLTASDGGTTALTSTGTATLTGGTFSGKVSTGTGGTLNITNGNVTLDSTPTNAGVYYLDGQYKQFLDALPAPVTDAEVGEATNISLTGVNAGVAYDIVEAETDDELEAEKTSATAFTLTPTDEGNYNLVLTATGNGQIFKLTLPVTVATGQLATPTDLAWDGTTPGKAKWGTVANASSYSVQLYKNSALQGPLVTGITDTEYDFTEAIASAGSGSYTFTVQAIGDGTDYANSPISAAVVTPYVYTATTTPLATPENPVWDTTTPGKIIAIWNTVPNAAQYRVYLYKSADGSGTPLETLENTNQRDFTVNIAQYGSGNYTFKVKAIPAAADTGHTDSAVSATSAAYSYTAPAVVCEISTLPTATPYTSLSDALAAVATSQTIKLLQDITHNQAVTIEGKNITFDLNGRNLKIDTGASHALEVKNGRVDLTDSTAEPGELNGSFDVIGTRYGVNAENGGIATVSNATATSTESGAAGARAAEAAQVTVKGSATGTDCGAVALHANSKVMVGGDATSTQNTGARARSGGQVTVNGDATGSIAGAYAVDANSRVTVNGDAKSDGINSHAVKAEAGGRVEAKNAIASGANSYGATATGSGATVYITGYAQGVQGGVWAQNSGEITVSGNVIAEGGGSCGAWANTGGKITIDGSMTAQQDYIKVGTTSKTAGDGTPDTEPEKSGYLKYTDGTSTVWVKTANACAIGSIEYPTLEAALATVGNGEAKTIKLLQDITTNQPIVVRNNKDITFNLNGKILTVDTDKATIHAQTIYALYVDSGGKVSLTGAGEFNVYAHYAGTYYAYGVYVTGAGSSATVTNAEAQSGQFNSGAYTDSSGQIIVLNNAKSSHIAVYAMNGGWISVGGNVEGGHSGAHAQNANSYISVSGNVTATGSAQYSRGVNATGANAKVIVDGNVTAPNAVGANAMSGGRVTIKGILSAKIYLTLSEVPKTINDYEDETTLEGYLTYTDDINTIWVNGTPPTTAPTAPQSFTTTPGDGQVVLSWTAPASNGGVAITGYQVSSDNGATWVPAGSSTGHTFTGLTNGQSYTFKVRAVNSVGNGAEATVTATPTAAPTAPTVPQNFTATPGNGQVTLSWAAPASNGGASIIRYEVSSDNGATWVPAGSSTGHTFTGLTNGQSYTFKVRAVNSVGNGVETTVTATPRSGGGSGGGGGGSKPSAPAQAIKAVVTEEGNVSKTTTVPVNVSSNSGTVNLDTSSVKDLLDGEGTILVTVPPITGVNDYTLQMPASILSDIKEGETLNLSTGSGSLTLPGNMLSGTGLGDTGNIGITLGQGDKALLSEEVRETLGSRPLVQLSLTVGGEQEEWNNPEAPVIVSIPYTPTAAELADPEHITVWYIDGSGNVVEVPSGRYDPATETVTFTTTHFSHYAVVYVHKTFGDLMVVDWAKDQIEVLASKGIVKGISDNEYAPQENITRANFLYSLVRTLNVNAKIGGNFEDIDPNAYYYTELAIAKKLGITTGTGNNKFDPDANITRQDMMTLTERAMRMLNKLQTQGTTEDLQQFSDRGLVASYAVDSVASVVKEGLIIGSGDKINPLGNTTRAEAAVFLYRIYNNQ